MFLPQRIDHLYAIVKMVEKLCKVHNIREGTVELCCDGLGALNRPPQTSWTTYATEQHFDISEASRQAMIKMPIKWKSRHVKEHQDDDNELESLDRYGKLNVEMDANAKAHWEQGSTQLTGKSKENRGVSG